MTTNTEKIIMYATTWCGDCVRAKRVFDQYNIDYQVIDLEKHPEAIPVVLAANNGRQSVPTIFFPDGEIMTEPSDRDLIAKITELTA